MTVTVETVGADGKPLYISSHNPVELNRRVKFEYQSDGKRGILRRDDKIDTIAEAPLPNRDIDQIRFGVTGARTTTSTASSIVSRSPAGKAQNNEDPIEKQTCHCHRPSGAKA